VGAEPTWTKRVTRCLGVASLALVFAGCAPVQFEYLRPTSSSGNVQPERPNCGGPNNAIVFATPNRVRVTLSAHVPKQSNAKQWTLRLTIARPVGERDRPFALAMDVDRITASWRDGRAELGPILPGGMHDWGVGSDFFVPGFSGGALDVQLPAMSIDGRAVEFPPVRFYRETGVFAQPMNC
jgi:hypothetical protein